MEIQHLTPWHSAPMAFAGEPSRHGTAAADDPAAAGAPGGTDDLTLEATRRALNALLHASATSLRFELDRSSATLFVRLVDETTGRIIRRFSTAQLLAASGMVGGQRGLLLDDRA